MRGDWVYLTVQRGINTAYGNLKVLTDKNGLKSKHTTIWRRLEANLPAKFNGIKIEKLPVNRSKRTKK